MPPKATPKPAETPPADQIPGQAGLPGLDRPETLETLAARQDHADTMIHTALTMLGDQQKMLATIHDQLLQVDGKQNGAAGQLQSVFEGTHKITDLLERYGPQIEHAAGFLDNPVQSYLAARKAGKNRAQNTPG